MSTNIQSIPSDSRKFRVAVAPLFVCVLVLGLLGLCSVVLMLDGMQFDQRALAFASASVLVCSLVGAWLLSRQFPAAFSADGIYGHSFWGRRRFVRWQGIAAAQPFRLLNLRWLRIYRIDYSEVIWLALFQSHKAEFEREMRRLAPAGSAIFKRWQ